MYRIKFIYNYLKTYRAKFIIITLASIAYSVIGLLASLVFSFVIDNVVKGLPINSPFLSFLNNLLGGMDYIRANFWIIAVALIAIYAIHALLMFYRYNGQAVVAEGLAKNMRDDLYDHIQHLPYAYHVRAKTGDLVQRCTSDVDTVRRFFSGQCIEIVVIFTSAIFAFYVLFTINFRLALIASITLPIVFIFSNIFSKYVQKQFLLADETEGVMTNKIQESLSGVRVIKAFHRERYEIDQFLTVSEKYRDVLYKMNSSMGMYWALTNMICMFGTLMILVFGVFFCQSGDLTIGDLTVFITYQTSVLFQIRQLGRILSDFSKVVVSIDRLIEVRNERPEDIKDGIYPDLDGDIVFDHVCFHYDDDPDTEILKDISITIPKSKTVAIVGPTGSGKSSLVQLLDRLYEPSSGAIYINGHNIRDVAKEHLRRNNGFVLQEPFLFSKTILDNIKVANPEISDETVYDAARIASVHDVIESFEQGYDTIVGERGVTLSGGQKQRVAIARTVVNNSNVLVFDDSLSAVDTETDLNIRQALKTLKGSTTMIIITQRVLTAKDADFIVVVEDGKITQKGTHEELINCDGLYSRINAIQSSAKEVL